LEVFCAPSLVQSNSRTVPIPVLQGTETGRLVAAGIAHDFGNVLTAIVLYSDLLVEKLEFQPRLHHLAVALRKAAHSGSSLVEKLTHRSCEEVVAARPTAWNEVVSDMRSLLMRLAGENIEIQTTLGKNLGYVNIDANRAQQAILSLVSNARHAMPQGGKITISTRNTTVRVRNSIQGIQTTRWVDFSVTDTGIGMDENTLAQVFRAFFTTKPSDQGTGVGLTMVHDFVRQGGGKVEIKSRLGKGTRVTVRMPRIIRGSQ
jgi:signal transduction histidine kinase